jgi:DNA polymerase bacteriophage-type
LSLDDVQGAGEQPAFPVYDLVDCGPRHRFVVLAADGPLIVHNCENITQAVARDVMRDAIIDLSAAVPGAYRLLLSVHDELIAETAEVDGPKLLQLMENMMTLPRSWTTGLPIAAAGWVGKRYRKG